MIYIVYKSFVQVGGAEKFLVEFFNELKRIHKVKLVFKEANPETISFFSLQRDDIIQPKRNNYMSWFYLLYNVFRKNDKILVQSGFKDIYILSFLKRFIAIYFLHHPHFNSLDHYDLLSVLHRRTKKEFIKIPENYKFYKTLLKKQKLNSNFIKTNISALVNYCSIRRADSIVVLSNYAKEEKHKYFNKTAIYIPPAISKNFIDSSLNNTEVNKQNQIIYFGRLSKEKRVDTLITSFKKIKTNTILKIIGDGEQLNNLKLLAKNDKRIIFTGFLNDKALFEEIKHSKLMITLEWADYNLTVYESLILGTRVLFGKTFGEEEFDAPFINSKMLFYCNPTANEVSHHIKKIISMDNPVSKDFESLKKMNWEKYVSTFNKKVLMK